MNLLHHAPLGHPDFIELYVTKEPNKFDVSNFLKAIGLEPSRTNYGVVIYGWLHVEDSCGHFFDVIVKVDHFIFLTDFVILDSFVDVEMPIILWWPFITIVEQWLT